MKNFTLISLLLGLAMCMGITAYHRPAQQDLPVLNMTRAVEVISLTPTGSVTAGGQEYRLVMRNISDKSINGYSIGYRERSAVTNDLTSAYKLIAPGDQFQERFRQATNIVIRHVIFEDGSIDGDATSAAEQQDRRDGMSEQLERIAPLLDAAAVFADIEELRAKVRALPEEAAPGRSVYVAAGMRNAKEDTLLDLEKLDKSNLRAGLARLIQFHNERKARLKKRATL